MTIILGSDAAGETLKNIIKDSTEGDTDMTRSSITKKALFISTCALLFSMLMMAGSRADTFYMTEQCYSRATGTLNKELFLIPGATHIKTYYVPEYVDQAVGKLAEFFGKNL